MVTVITGAPANDLVRRFLPEHGRTGVRTGPLGPRKVEIGAQHLVPAVVQRYHPYAVSEVVGFHEAIVARSEDPSTRRLERSKELQQRIEACLAGDR